MKTEYLRTAKNSYMIVKDADFEFESYELEMVLQNDLKNLVPMQVLVADGKVEYWFDVTGMKTLEQELSVADADREMIKLLLESICSVKMELEEYLLDDKDIPNDFSQPNRKSDSVLLYSGISLRRLSGDPQTI